MAFGCIASGVMLALQAPGARVASAAAQAMVVYSALNAAGYYAEQGEAAAAVGPCRPCRHLGRHRAAAPARRRPCRQTGQGLETPAKTGRPRCKMTA